MNEGGVKAWEPHQVQNPLAFSDEEEEDLLEFMYKYKTTRKTAPPLEVHSARDNGVERVCAERLCTRHIARHDGAHNILQGLGMKGFSFHQKDRPSHWSEYSRFDPIWSPNPPRNDS